MIKKGEKKSFDIKDENNIKVYDFLSRSTDSYKLCLKRNEWFYLVKNGVNYFEIEIPPPASEIGSGMQILVFLINYKRGS